MLSIIGNNVVPPGVTSPRKRSVSWRDKSMTTFVNKHKIQVVGGQTGLKGAKLAKNSQFVRMQSYLKRKGPENPVKPNDNFTTSNLSPDQHPSIA